MPLVVIHTWSRMARLAVDRALQVIPSWAVMVAVRCARPIL